MSVLPHMLSISLAGGLDQGGELAGIIGLTVAMTLISTGLAALAGFPAGVALAVRSFPGKRLLRRLIQTLMSLPPVVAGLAVFLVLSRRGPLGSMNLLFSLPAMVIAQFILIFPIIVSLTLTTVESRQQPIRETLGSLGLPAWRIRLLVLWETRRTLLTIMLTGFGRSISEVGAVMMVGGNIQGKTRVMTTAILLETNKGQFDQAIILGLILLGLAFALNALAGGLQEAVHD